MRLAVFSHKACWRSAASPSGWATDGGFPYQIRALSELFDATEVLVPCSPAENPVGEEPLVGERVRVVPLTPLRGSGLARKLRFPFWCLRNAPSLWNALRKADAVHTPIPGDVGTIGIVAALLLRKRLFVRHCGNWFVQRTAAERFWKWLMERYASPINVMLATGGGERVPSARNPAIGWIFSTTLTEAELSTRQARQERVPGPAPRLIIACRQSRDKGVSVLIESLPLILARYPEARLDVVGDGEALDEFRRLAAERAVADRVRFHGKLPHAEVLARLRDADLFCYPTTASEGFPKVVLEALACGLPVVATRVSVIPRLLEPGAGMLLEEASARAVADGVCRCLEDRERYRAMSSKALDTARQYSLERWAESIGALLRTAWGPLRSRV